MKRFTFKADETWHAGNWDQAAGGVLTIFHTASGALIGNRLFSHESDVPDAGAPQAWREHVLREILANRPLGDGERRVAGVIQRWVGDRWSGRNARGELVENALHPGLALPDGFSCLGWGNGREIVGAEVRMSGECCHVFQHRGTCLVGNWKIHHESEIPQDWPDTVKAVIAKEVLERRPSRKARRVYAWGKWEGLAAGQGGVTFWNDVFDWCVVTHEKDIPEGWSEADFAFARREILANRPLESTEWRMNRFRNDGPRGFWEAAIFKCHHITREGLVDTEGTLHRPNSRETIARGHTWSRASGSDGGCYAIWRRMLPDILDEDETLAGSVALGDPPKFGRMSIAADGRLQVTWPDGHKTYYTREELERQRNDGARRIAYLDKVSGPKLAPCPHCGNEKPEYQWDHLPNHVEVECGKCAAYTWGETAKAAGECWNARTSSDTSNITKRPRVDVAENQVLDGDGKPRALRWRDGSPEHLYDGRWIPWKLGHYGWAEDADAWFRAHCPIDRFVTDDGKVLEFPKWRTVFHPEGADPAVVHVWLGSIIKGRVNASGVLQNDNDWPPHILAEARAKFRENYTLKPNEIWFQGMPVEMEFVQSPGCREHVVARGAGNLLWVETARREEWGKAFAFTDEAERLEAFDRMRRFFYEMHPGKAWHETKAGGNGLTFEMKGSIGHALFHRSTVWTSDHPNSQEYPEWEYRGREKLKHWTEAQLAKRPVVFEASPLEYQIAPDPSGSGEKHSLWFKRFDSSRSHVRAMQDFKLCRVTIEPIESEEP